MSATRDLIAAALTAADLMDETIPYFHVTEELRELCARAMVQPDMGEVKNLVSAACNLMFDAGKLLGRRDAGADREVEDARSARTALLDYVRGVMAERDALIHDNERSIYGDTREAAGYARGKLEAVPSGYWLAPVEPTPEMKSAGLNVEVGENNHVLTWTEVAAIYREMRDASLHGEVKP